MMREMKLGDEDQVWYRCGLEPDLLDMYMICLFEIQEHKQSLYT